MAPAAPPSIVHLTDGTVSLLLAHTGATPRLVHWGDALGPIGDDPLAAAALHAAVRRPATSGMLDIDTPLALIAEPARGHFGRPGIEGSRPDGRDWAPAFTLGATRTNGDGAVTFELTDPHARLALELAVVLAAGSVATISATVTNTGADPYELRALRLSVPVAAAATELMTIGGRWTNEFGLTRTPWEHTTVTVENRRGRTSHERLPVLIAGTPGFGEQRGEVWAAHLGWSGNYELTADVVTDARRSFQAGELLLPGELVLAPGERYSSPTLYLAHSAAGLTPLSQAFHRYLRSRPGHPTTPRPVLLNTWEAVYFDHDLATLTALADRAAECGVERFVLDDGWFHARRNDSAGLGDWWVDESVWPRGLTPLVDHVRGLGLQFGIWFEPEMVNPDSDLFRAHPDWAIVDERYEPVLARNQLVLDLGRPEVRDHLFGQIHAVLGAHDIAYVKWDMNREPTQPTGADGRAGVHRQTLGLYELLRRLRAAHPAVEFETCASGGGRVDFAILEHMVRVWTSDSIDALDRQAIQRGFSVLFPPELMGSHIGSPTCHTTGRRHRLALRAGSAFFGALGVEWNLLEATEADRADLTRIIGRHRELRGLLHRGDVVRLDHPDPNVTAHGVVAADRSEALFCIVRLASGPSLHTPTLRLAGLDPDRPYSARLLELAPQPWGMAKDQPVWVTGELTLTGRQFGALGLPVPVMLPESAVLVHLTSVGAASPRA